LQIEDDMNGLTDISEPTTNGPIRGGSLSRRMRDWDASYDTANTTASRTDLIQRRDSLWTRFYMDPSATGNIGKLVFDVFRVGSTAPVSGKAFLSWNDGGTAAHRHHQHLPAYRHRLVVFHEPHLEQFPQWSHRAAHRARSSPRSPSCSKSTSGAVTVAGYIDLDNILLRRQRHLPSAHTIHR
jgi:hypothetical protein